MMCGIDAKCVRFMRGGNTTWSDDEVEIRAVARGSFPDTKLNSRCDAGEFIRCYVTFAL